MIVGLERFWKNTWIRRCCYGHLWGKKKTNTCPALVYSLATIVHIPPTCKIYILLNFQDSPGVASHYGFRLRPKVKGLGPVIFLTHSQNTVGGQAS